MKFRAMWSPVLAVESLFVLISAARLFSPFCQFPLRPRASKLRQVSFQPRLARTIHLTTSSILEYVSNVASLNAKCFSDSCLHRCHQDLVGYQLATLVLLSFDLPLEDVQRFSMWCSQLYSQDRTQHRLESAPLSRHTLFTKETPDWRASCLPHGTVHKHH